MKPTNGGTAPCRQLLLPTAPCIAVFRRPLSLRVHFSKLSVPPYCFVAYQSSRRLMSVPGLGKKELLFLVDSEDEVVETLYLNFKVSRQPLALCCAPLRHSPFRRMNISPTAVGFEVSGRNAFNSGCGPRVGLNHFVGRSASLTTEPLRTSLSTRLNFPCFGPRNAQRSFFVAP